LRTIRLEAEYDGSLFKGFADQPNERTVQGTLKGALEKACGGHIKIAAASRTDSGVHALGQTISFCTSCPIPAERFPQALRAFLPEDINIKSAKEVKEGFDPRRAARKKKYSYFIFSGRETSPMVARYVWRVSPGLDVASMKKAARLIVGRRDFFSFAATDRRRKIKRPVKKIYSIRFAEGNVKKFFGELAGEGRGKMIRIDFIGDSFLYKMVRTIVGTLVDVGEGRIKASTLPDILRSKDRARAGRTAPARGLFLVKVYY